MRRGRTGHRWSPPTVSGLRRVKPRVATTKAVIGAYRVRWVKITGIADYRWVDSREKATVFRDVATAEYTLRSFLYLMASDAEVEELPCK